MNDLWIGISIYLGLGTLWAMYNMKSRFAQRVMDNSIRNQMLVWHFIGTILAILIWPIGFGLHVFLLAAGRSRRRDSSP